MCWTIKRSRLEPWLRSLCLLTFLGKTLSSLFTPSCVNGYWQNSPCDRLTCHPGGVEILLVSSCYRNQDKLRPYEPIGLYAGYQNSRYIHKPDVPLGLDTNFTPTYEVTRLVYCILSNNESTCTHLSSAKYMYEQVQCY